MAKNRQIREKLEEIYGHTCMLHQGLKINGYSKSKVNYAGKSIEKQLTLHHIVPKSKGGATSVENGAVLCRGCHDFLENTSKANRDKINGLLIKYKQCVLEYGDDFTTGIEINMAEIELNDREAKVRRLEKYNRAEEKRKTQKMWRDLDDTER